MFSANKSSSAVRKMLALDISDEVVVAALWEVDHGQINLVQTSSPIEWQDGVDSDIVEAADVAIEELGEKALKVDNVLFGVPDSWVIEQSVIAERKVLLKKLKEELSLQPFGFVVTSEALLSYIRDLEGGNLTCMMVQLSTTQLRAMLVKDQQVLRVENVGRSGDAIADFTEALTRLKDAVIPPRILLYSPRLKIEDLENQKATLESKNWVELGILKTPMKVEVLPHAVCVTAVCLSAGKEIAKQNGWLQEVAVSTAKPVQNVETPAVVPAVAESTKTNEITADLVQTVAPVPPLTPKAPALKPLLSSEPVHSNLETVATVMPVVKSEVSQPVSVVSSPMTSPVAAPSPILASSSFGFEEVGLEDADHGRKVNVDVDPSQTKKLSLFSPFTRLFRSLTLGGTLQEKVESDRTKKKPVALLLGIVLILILGGCIAGYVGLKNTYSAQISLTLTPAPLSKNIAVTLSPSVDKTDVANRIIKVKTVQEQAQGQKEVATTGTKIVGDKASGKVTVYNRTAVEKTIPIKTQLTSPDGTKYSFSAAVKVPASTTGADYSIQPGKVDATITAIEIGSESNLKEKVELSIVGFTKSDMLAVVGSDGIVGGASREITAVSKDDVQKLEAALKAELTAQATAKLQQVSSGNQRVVSTGETQVKEKKLSVNVGDEAKVVQMSLTVVAQALVYTPEDIMPLAQAELQESLPNQSVLLAERTSLTIKSATPSASKEVIAEVEVNTAQVPTVSAATIKNIAFGLTPEAAIQAIHKQFPQAQASVRFSPAFAERLFATIPTADARVSTQQTVGK